MAFSEAVRKLLDEEGVTVENTRAWITELLTCEPFMSHEEFKDKTGVDLEVEENLETCMLMYLYDTLITIEKIGTSRGYKFAEVGLDYLEIRRRFWGLIGVGERVTFDSYMQMHQRRGPVIKH